MQFIFGYIQASRKAKEGLVGLGYLVHGEGHSIWVREAVGKFLKNLSLPWGLRVLTHPLPLLALWLEYNYYMKSNNSKNI